jgi:hypothetical protein
VEKCFGLVWKMLMQDVAGLPGRLVEMRREHSGLVADLFGLLLFLEVVDLECACADAGGVVEDEYTTSTRST